MKPWLGKVFRFMVFRLAENAFANQIFTIPPPKTLSLALTITTQSEKNYLLHPDTIFLNISFHPNPYSAGGTIKQYANLKLWSQKILIKTIACRYC